MSEKIEYQIYLSPALNNDQIKILNDFGEANHCMEYRNLGGYDLWRASDDGTELWIAELDDYVKCADLVEWLDLINEIYLKEWNIIMNGTITYQHKDDCDEDNWEIGYAMIRGGEIRRKIINVPTILFTDLDELDD